MQSDEYEYYSDSSVEEDNDQPIDVESIYKDITDSFRETIDNNPLYNDLSLSGVIESRIMVLSDLYDVITDRYINDLDCSWFRFELDDLKEAIYSFAKLLDDMETKYEDLESSLDTGARYHVRLFPSPLDEYLNDTRREIVKDFNEFISKNTWLVFESTQEKVRKQLPLLDELKIPEDLI